MSWCLNRYGVTYLDGYTPDEINAHDLPGSRCVGLGELGKPRDLASALVAYNGGTSVGHGPVGNLCLGLILCLVPMTPCETMLYWPSRN